MPNVRPAPGPSSSPYKNPFRSIKNLLPERIDQGVDYSGSGPFYPIGNAVVTNLYNSGWPGGGFISYRLTDGPAAGKYVYVAEQVSPGPNIRIGSRVTPNTILGYLGSYLETGWAAPPGTGDSLAAQQGQGTFPTQEGLNFNTLLRQTGAPSGTVNGKAPPGEGGNAGGTQAQTTSFWGAIANGILGAPAGIVGGALGAGISAGLEDGFIALYNQLFGPLLKRLWYAIEIGGGALGVTSGLVILAVAGLVHGVERRISPGELAGAVAAAPETGGASLLIGATAAQGKARREKREVRQQAQLDQAAQRIVISGQRQETNAAREARLAKESDAALARSTVQSAGESDRAAINQRINERLARIRAERAAKESK